MFNANMVIIHIVALFYLFLALLPIDDNLWPHCHGDQLLATRTCSIQGLDIACKVSTNYSFKPCSFVRGKSHLLLPLNVISGLKSQISNAFESFINISRGSLGGDVFERRASAGT